MEMKTSHLFYSLLFIFLFILGCQTRPPDIDLTQPACFDFELLEFGNEIPDGNDLLAGIFTAQKDDWITDGHVKVDSNNVGAGNNIRLFNINLHLNLGQPISKVSFDFAELGGVNKIIINGVAYNFSDFPELQNTIIDSVGFSINATQQRNNWKGIFKAKGKIENFAIGGQELWLDNFCADRFEVLLENRRDDPYDNPTNPDGSLTQYNRLRQLMTERGIYFTEKVEDGTLLTLEYLNQFDLYVWYLIGISTVSDAEVAVIENYVSQGGSVFILVEYDSGYSSPNVDDALAAFGAAHGSSKIEHPTNNWNNWPTHVYYNHENILDPAAKLGVQQIMVSTATYFTELDENWVTVLETDNGAEPPNMPVIIRKNYGAGKVMIAGDFSFAMNIGTNVGDMDNDIFIGNLLYLLLD